MPEDERQVRPRAQRQEMFPILAEGPYLNHAAVGPWPRCTAQAVQEFAEENTRFGPANYPAWIQREAKLRRGLAALIGAERADDIALLKNTTEGISAVAWGLDWRSGDNVVLPSAEFPSNRLPWLAQAAQGVEVREVDIRGVQNPEAALIDAMDDHTRLLTVSAVAWSDGFRLDLEPLGAACRQRGALFFVDAIQQLGALPIDVTAARVDFLAADAHKWLLAPEGIAVFYCRQALRPELALRQRGWHMFDDPWNFDRRDWTPSESARRFEAGSPNSCGQAALLASLQLLLEFGLDRVGHRVLENTAHLIERLQGLPRIRLVSRTESPRRSGIVSFHCDSMEPREIYRRLRTIGVSCAVRGDAIRLSPHFYQDQSVLDDALDALEIIIRG